MADIITADIIMADIITADIIMADIITVDIILADFITADIFAEQENSEENLFLTIFFFFIYSMCESAHILVNIRLPMFRHMYHHHTTQIIIVII